MSCARGDGGGRSGDLASPVSGTFRLRVAWARMVLLCAMVAFCGCSAHYRGTPIADAQDRRELVRVAPGAVGIEKAKLERVDDIVAEVVAAGRTAGAVVVIGKGHSVLYRRAYGDLQVAPRRRGMRRDAVFDLASISKPVSTAAGVMLLYDEGKVDIDGRASRYLSEFDTPDKRGITVRQLLTHTSGLPAGIHIPTLERRAGPGPNAQAYYEAIARCPLSATPGTRFIYSDVNYAALAHLVAVVAGQRMDEYLRERLYRPLGMKSTGYYLGRNALSRTAPNKPAGAGRIGLVHDPTARYIQDGAAAGGNAGLFSSADDLARFARMLLNGGTWDGHRLLSERAVELMTTRQTRVAPRSLGWHVFSSTGEAGSATAISHTGWTGTYMYVNFQHEVFVIYLTNRTHLRDEPDATGRRVNEVMAVIADALGFEY
ncbi:beta-lactamase family protein [bacterium]|nr:beta-lactamase family protein [bacterium]